MVVASANFKVDQRYWMSLGQVGYAGRMRKEPYKFALLLDAFVVQTNEFR